jgi:hypothetical protein
VAPGPGPGAAIHVSHAAGERFKPPVRGPARRARPPGGAGAAPRRAGLTRESLHRLLRQYEIRSEQYKDAAGEVVLARIAR